MSCFLWKDILLILWLLWAGYVVHSIDFYRRLFTLWSVLFQQCNFQCLGTPVDPALAIYRRFANFKFLHWDGTSKGYAEP